MLTVLCEKWYVSTIGRNGGEGETQHETGVVNDTVLF
jgi:hypothetical protein